jgi:vacuolar protein sorting-associated protein VTA1
MHHFKCEPTSFQFKKVAKLNEQLDDSQGILSETVGGSIVEDYATKVFNYADQEDRAARFHK